MLRYLNASIGVIFAVLSVTPVMAKDDLLETLAQKGVLTLDEYEKLKAQRKTEVTLNLDEGFRVVSADGGTSMQVGTLQQLDIGDYHGDRVDLSDGTEMRRSRLSLTGTFLKDWQYRVEYEFSGTTAITDAYLAYGANKPLLVTAGQFKQPFSMEAVASDKNVTFMERGLPFGFLITRAAGLMIGSSGARWSANIGAFGEPVGNVQAGDEGFGFTGRVTYAPILGTDRVLHVGLGTTWREPTDENSTNATGPRFSTVRFRNKPESNILAQRLIDTGEIVGVDNYSIGGLEFAGQLGAASFQSEYQFVQVKRDLTSSLDFDGWYAQVAYTLTGESRPYKGDKGFFDGIRPRTNFGSDGWGAFEVALRASEMDLRDDDINGGKERNATAGLNWYLNPVLRVSANVVKVLEMAGGPFDDEEPTIYQMRLQLAL